MKVLLYDNPDKVTATELQHDLLLLPYWRKEQVLSYRNLVDKVQCAKAYILLQQCLTEQYGIQNIPPFGYGQYGKPFLPQVHFNLSHCKKGVMCVVDDNPVGCDIEVIPNKIDTELVVACFSTDEQASIMNAGSPEIEFARLWTAKEAVLKLTGTGLTDDLPYLLTSSWVKDITYNTVVSEANGYVYTIAKNTISTSKNH